MLHDLWIAITTTMESWHEGKLFIEHVLTINHDTLHMMFGVVIWLALCLVTRRTIASPYPWLWLLALILWNETVDLWNEQWPHPGQQYGEGAKDILVTMAVPTLLMLAGRYVPTLFVRKKAVRTTEDTDSI
ncbi:MAG TPA: hypothetical protein VK821_09875 [Dehalococcoidia bacterium]|nr:hypothetical protein [Dehalococcoidia bacterium]